jgi:hypothetical protein
VSPRRSPLFTRRRVLTGLGVGFVATGVFETGAFDSTEAPRTSTVQVAGDGNAILALKDFKESETYDSPHVVEVTNNTGTTLSDNTVSSKYGRLEFQTDSKGPSSSLTPSEELSDDTSETFEIVTADGETGNVSDKVTLSYAKPDEISIEVTRNITVSFIPIRLVYVVGGEIRVYDPDQDKELNPPNSTAPDYAISGSAADFTAGDKADIAFATSNGMYLTEVDGSENQIEGSPSNHDIRKQDTRFALAKWPGFKSRDTDVEHDEWAIVDANSNRDKLFAMDADGNTEEIDANGNTEEEIESLNNGTVGASGVADIDNDGKKEMVFLDNNKNFRYINQGGSTSKLENPNGDDAQAGSDTSIGFGPPVSFGDSTFIPFINQSSQPSVVNQNGEWDPLPGNAKNAPCALFDIDDDDGIDFVFIDSNGDIAYVDFNDNYQVKKLKINGNKRKPNVSVGLNSGTRTN